MYKYASFCFDDVILLRHVHSLLIVGTHAMLVKRDNITHSLLLTTLNITEALVHKERESDC